MFCQSEDLIVQPVQPSSPRTSHHIIASVSRGYIILQAGKAASLTGPSSRIFVETKIIYAKAPRRNRYLSKLEELTEQWQKTHKFKSSKGNSRSSRSREINGTVNTGNSRSTTSGRFTKQPFGLHAVETVSGTVVDHLQYLLSQT